MRRATKDDYNRRVLRALNHIQEHLDEDLSPAELARVAAFSPHHFHRVFRGVMGESLMAHVRRLRLERAATWLKNSEESVTDIGLRSGYETHEAFTRAFRALFQSSPSEFRRSKQANVPAVPNGVHFVSGSAVDRVGGEPMASRFPVNVVLMPRRRVAYVHHRGPYAAVSSAWDELMTWAGAHGLITPGAELLGRCHDDPDITVPGNLRYDACITVPEEVTEDGSIGVKEIPAGEYATTRHRGPYESLASTYAGLFGGWLPQSGREAAAAPCVETYFNDPESTAPEDLETDVSILLVSMSEGE